MLGSLLFMEVDYMKVVLMHSKKIDMHPFVVAKEYTLMTNALMKAAGSLGW